MIRHEAPQHSELWWSLRLGKPTASHFSEILTGTGKPSTSLKKYATRLANEIIAGKRVDEWRGNDATERGDFFEHPAREMYSLINDVDVFQCGFVTDDDEQYGCTPDFLVGEDGCGEIKCINGADHSLAILRYQKDGDFDPGYKPQAQGHLLVTGRKWTDLFFYHPSLPRLIIRCERDEEFLAKLAAGIRETIKVRDEILASLKAFGGAT